MSIPHDPYDPWAYIRESVTFQPSSTFHAPRCRPGVDAARQRAMLLVLGWRQELGRCGEGNSGLEEASHIFPPSIDGLKWLLKKWLDNHKSIWTLCSWSTWAFGYLRMFALLFAVFWSQQRLCCFFWCSGLVPDGCT